MLRPIQALLWIPFLRHFAAPVFGARIIGSPVFRTLEVSPELPVNSEPNLGDLPTKIVDDKFDAFQESFTDGVTSFDDDSKEYVDDSFMDAEPEFPLALDPQILEQLIPKKPKTEEPERTTQEPNSLPAGGPSGNKPIIEAQLVEAELPTVEAGPTKAESPVVKAELVKAELPAVGVKLGEVELEQTPTEFTPIRESAVGVESVATELEPTRTEFASEARDPSLFNQICRSREFQPTLENWWISGADRWLKNYTVDNRNSPAFRAFGLVGSIEKKYLHATDFECGIIPGEVFRPDTCRVSCIDIVGRVGDIEEAKRVFFVLAGVAGLAERIGGIYVSFRFLRIFYRLVHQLFYHSFRTASFLST